MKEKVSAIISFISAIGWGLLGLFFIAQGDIDHGDEFFGMFSFMTMSISTILYVIWTKFGQRERSELEKIDYDNQILKKQIEQQELLKKLEK